MHNHRGIKEGLRKKWENSIKALQQPWIVKKKRQRKHLGKKRTTSATKPGSRNPAQKRKERTIEEKFENEPPGVLIEEYSCDRAVDF